MHLRMHPFLAVKVFLRIYFRKQERNIGKIFRRFQKSFLPQKQLGKFQYCYFSFQCSLLFPWLSKSSTTPTDIFMLRGALRPCQGNLGIFLETEKLLGLKTSMAAIFSLFWLSYMVQTYNGLGIKSSYICRLPCANIPQFFFAIKIQDAEYRGWLEMCWKQAIYTGFLWLLVTKNKYQAEISTFKGKLPFFLVHIRAFLVTSLLKKDTRNVKCQM